MAVTEFLFLKMSVMAVNYDDNKPVKEIDAD